MSLVTYKQKRTFSKTPEPTGGKPDVQQLRFVIQKHAASHLHYDFRLEMRGVLKSWAVPKGPSMDPAVKRLAMMVEDHPYDYRTFEGIIPQGEYGGGTVIVWDEGTYETLDGKGDKKAQEKSLLAQLHAGSLKFRMKGKKLKGEFALVKTSGRGENSWLLIKHRDAHASTDDITLKDKSVVSKKTLEQVAKTSDNIYGQTKRPAAKKTAKKTTAKKSTPAKPAASKAAPKKAVKKTAAKKTAAKKTAPKKAVSKTGVKAAAKKMADQAPAKKKSGPSVRSLVQSGAKTKLPLNIRPMLATLVDKPFDREGWIYEVKWDGYRALALMSGDTTELKSRNDKSFNEKFYPIHHALQAMGLEAVLDGEVVVLKENGLSDFGSLQNWRSEADGELVYYAFDILWLNGHDLTQLPLEDRKIILKETLPESDLVRISESFNTSGTEFFDVAKQTGLEGIIAKKANSTYDAGGRNKDWLKIKSLKRQEVVIGGYTRNEDTSKLFSSLLVGVFEGKHFQYTGKIGTGFSDKLQREMMAQFKPLVTKKSPFDVIPDVNKPSRFRPNPPAATATWLKPKLVCEVSFTEMTSDGVMRHPSFEGMRIDKKASEVTPEIATDTEEAVQGHQKLKEQKFIKPSKGKERKTLLNPTEDTQVKKVNGHELKFSHLSKIYWPQDGVSKRDMLNYYYQVAPFILPYLNNRPQSLNRHPNGIKGHSFYQKDVTGKAPEWVKLFPYKSEDEPQQKNFLVCTDEASLLYMASLGCIELNPWSSTVDNPDKPDWCIIDLDPDKHHFDKVIEAAQVTHEVLESLGIPSYCKTSGSTGLHVYIPLGGKYTYEQSKEFARVVVTLVQRQIPRFTTLERTVANRGGKMYLDFLQNRPQATIAAPYSLRPKPGATVSMPLHWDEVKKGVKMSDFNIFNAMDRLKETGDIFKPVLGKGIDLARVIRRIEAA